MPRRRTVLFALVLLLTAASVPYAADTPKSGPQPGDSIPGPFHPVNANGAYAGDPHCLVCEYGLRPVVAVFVREAGEVSKPLTTLLQKLDEAAAKHRDVGLAAFAVFLSDDFAKEQVRSDFVRRLEAVAKEADLKQVILAADAPAGVESYKLNKDAEVTVILYRRLRVEASFASAKDGLADKEIATVLAAVQKLTAQR
jgi:hypothetical protein